MAKSGESSTCHTMAGTPPKLVTLSRSMSSRARSGSHLCIMTSLPPAAVLATRTEWQPVAWKSGTLRRYEFCSPLLVSKGDWPSLARIAPRAATKNRLIRLVQMLRWVPTAPLDRPVVPDV